MIFVGVGLTAANSFCPCHFVLDRNNNRRTFFTGGSPASVDRAVCWINLDRGVYPMRWGARPSVRDISIWRGLGKTHDNTLSIATAMRGKPVHQYDRFRFGWGGSPWGSCAWDLRTSVGGQAHRHGVLFYGRDVRSSG